MAEKSIVDNYEIGRLLGKGASAKVRLVRDTNTGAEYAMKILRKEGAGAMA
jgi:serine/threonine protein kinase